MRPTPRGAGPPRAAGRNLAPILRVHEDRQATCNVHQMSPRHQENLMPLSRKTVVAFAVSAAVSALAGFVMAATEYSGATCAQANCADCQQGIQRGSSVCPAN